MVLSPKELMASPKTTNMRDPATPLPTAPSEPTTMSSTSRLSAYLNMPSNDTFFSVWSSFSCLPPWRAPSRLRASAVASISWQLQLALLVCSTSPACTVPCVVPVPGGGGGTVYKHFAGSPEPSECFDSSWADWVLRSRGRARESLPWKSTFVRTDLWIFVCGFARIYRWHVVICCDNSRFTAYFCAQRQRSH